MAASQTNSEYVARKRGDSPAVNLVSFYAGMVTSLVLLMMLWNAWQTSSRIDQVLQGQSSGASAAASKSVDVPGGGLQSNDFEMVLQSGSVTQLESLQQQLKSAPLSSPLSVQMHHQERRIRVANRLLQLPLETDLRKRTVLEKMDALSMIFLLDFVGQLHIPDVTPNAIVFAQEHMDSADPEIAKAAKLAIVKVRTHDVAKQAQLGKEFNAKAAIDAVHRLVIDYPDDTPVADSLQLTITSMTQADPQSGFEVVQQFLAQPASSPSPQAVLFRQNLKDDLTLYRLDYSKKFKNRDLHAKNDQGDLAQLTLELARDEAGSTKLIRAAAEGADWFEEIDRLDLAQSVYQTLVDSADKRNIPSIAEFARKTGENGLTRCALVGHSMLYNGLQFNNPSQVTLLDPEQFEDKIVVLVFWSANNKSANGLIGMSPQAKKQSRDDVVYVAVCTDPLLDSIHTAVARKLPGFVHVVCTPGEAPEPTLTEQCPVARTPYALVIDRQGLVRKLNVPLKDVSTEIELLGIESAKQ